MTMADIRHSVFLRILMTMADIRHSVFFAHAEFVLKNWHAKHALKSVYGC
jgi:hypothetical protein